MNYDEYVRGGYLQYDELARRVAAILRAAIDDSDKKFRVQQISFRAKEPDSLRRKLTERGLLASDAIEVELKDLAGCRLVFYTNTDIDRFLNAQLISENFEVDWDGSNIHHSVGVDRPAERLYFAIHCLVSLKDERLALPEYRKFRGLRCEIQLQTILNHAWAETTHDILYHRPDIEGFGTKQFSDIRGRLTKIMNKHLLPAGYEFQKVQHDFERLQQGKELFDRNTVEALRTADNNNDRYDLLRRIREDLLPYYDDVRAVATDIIRSTVEAIKKARSTPTKDIVTLIGNFPGHTSEQVISSGLELIESLKYVDVQQTFHVLCELFVSANTGSECNQIVLVAERLSQNSLNIWRQAGFVVQKLLMECITGLSDSERVRVRPVVLAVARQILEPEISGTSWKSDSVSIQQGAVPASDAFSVLRGHVIELLFRMYEESGSEKEQRDVIHALNQATRFPMSGKYGDALVKMVFSDTTRIVSFFASRADKEEFEILQILEHNFLFLYRRTKDLKKVEGAERIVIELGNEVLAAIEQFRERANSRQGFERFKTLVGYESVFPPDWETAEWDVGKRHEYRSARLSDYAQAVNKENADEWYGIIERCAAVRSEDTATFPSLAEFIKQLAERSPRILLSYLERGSALISFLPAVLAGLTASSEPAIATELVEKWIANGEHIAAIARHLRLTRGLPSDLLRKAGEVALASKVPLSIFEVIAAVIVNGMVDQIDDIIVPGIRYFTEERDTRWVVSAWYLPELQPFLRGLSKVQAEVLLDNLMLCRRIDYAEEEVLLPIAANYPVAVWAFFKARVDLGARDDAPVEYESIPFRFQKLHIPLSMDVELAVDTIRSWYRVDNRLFTYRGAQLLKNVFPDFGTDLETRLISILADGSKDGILFVLGILRAYEGQGFLHGVCKEIVNCLDESDELLQEVELVLHNTGVVAGQFGFVEAYQRKKEEAEPWLADERVRVRKFGQRYQRFLDREIAAEQRRSEADQELRRRSWPDEEA